MSDPKSDIDRMARFVQARIAEDRAAIPAVGDDPFLPHGQHWSEVPFPTASAARGLAMLDAMEAVARRVSDVRWTGSYAVRDVVIADLATVWRDHPDHLTTTPDSTPGGGA